jgi:hypothetical protein
VYVYVIVYVCVCVCVFVFVCVCVCVCVCVNVCVCVCVCVITSMATTGPPVKSAARCVIRSSPKGATMQTVRLDSAPQQKPGVRVTTREGMQTAECAQRKAETKERKVGTKKHTIVLVNSKSPFSVSYTDFTAESR